MLIELKKVHLKALADGTIILEGYDNYGYHIERELNYASIENADFTQEYLDVKFRKRKKVYRVWLKNIDFSKVIVPLYVRGFSVKENCIHAFYAVVAEASYFINDWCKGLNFEYLKETPEISKFYVDKNLAAMIDIMVHAAGINIRIQY